MLVLGGRHPGNTAFPELMMTKQVTKPQILILNGLTGYLLGGGMEAARLALETSNIFLPSLPFTC